MAGSEVAEPFGNEVDGRQRAGSRHSLKKKLLGRVRPDKPEHLHREARLTARNSCGSNKRRLWSMLTEAADHTRAQCLMKLFSLCLGNCEAPCRSRRLRGLERRDQICVLVFCEF